MQREKMVSFTGMNLYVALYILMCLGNGFCANILILTHMQPSHVAENCLVGEALVHRGHQIYTIMPESSSQVERVRKKGINVITFSTDPEDVYMDSSEYEDELAKNVFEEDKDLLKLIELTVDVTTAHCRKILYNNSILQQVQNINPDIAIVDPFPVNYCHFLLPYNYSIPYASIFSTSNFWDIGVPALPSFVPSDMMEAGDRLSFVERIKTTFFAILGNSDYNFLFPYFDGHLRRKYAPSVKSWHEFSKENLFFAMTRDEILERPFPRMPNLVAYPGITYSPAKPLPKDLDQVIVNAKKVILVSFGSSGGFLPAAIFHTFLNVFKDLTDYDILWKFPERHLKNRDLNTIPKNVHFRSWLPQNDILGHPKTTLFLTHCGNNGQYESLYHGVPMLGFPLYAEQPHNAFRMQDRGYGMVLDIHHFTAEQLYNAMLNVMSNVTIHKNVQKASAMLKDRRLHPKEEIADMVEHVMKYGGSHLRSVSITMPWYQLLMMDILLFLLFIIVSICILLCVSCKLLSNLFCHARKAKKE